MSTVLQYVLEYLVGLLVVGGIGVFVGCFIPPLGEAVGAILGIIWTVIFVGCVLVELIVPIADFTVILWALYAVYRLIAVCTPEIEPTGLAGLLGKSLLGGASICFWIGADGSHQYHDWAYEFPPLQWAGKLYAYLDGTMHLTNWQAFGVCILISAAIIMVFMVVERILSGNAGCLTRSAAVSE